MKHLPWFALSIDRAAAQPVFEQICAEIRKRTISGDLPEGAVLPSTRVFATELGVSRSTIVTAYEQLVAEGYLTSRRGSGHRVCAVGEADLAQPRARTKGSRTEERPTAPIPFEAGQPDMRLFPHRQWAKTVARVCRANPQAMLVGGKTFGNPDLCRAIAAHVSDWRGIDATPDQVIITAGSTDGLEICMRSLTEPGDTVAMEDPGYAPMHRFARAQLLKPQFLQVDDQGAALPLGSTCAPRLAMLTPSHQYPLGGAMSPNRRLEFLRWAADHDAWILEDDYDSEFRYAGRPIPAMAGFDRLNRTIYLGSFSKIFSNTLRMGYLVVPESLLDRFRATIRRFGVKASYMPQQALAEFIDTGEFYRHLRRVRRIYGERRKYLLDRLQRDFAEFGWFEDHQAGMQVAFHLNAGLVDTEICTRAVKAGLAVEALSEFSIGETGHNGLLLGFCAYSVEELEPALDTLLEMMRP